MRVLILAWLIALNVVALAADNLAQPDRSKNSPAFAPVTDDPKLPRVLLIGDSISIDYTVPVRKALEGKANVHRVQENGGPTSNGVEKIDKWLGTGKWNVIHFNWGLHDVKIMDGEKRQVSIEDYEKNLRALVKKMKATGAKLIWASTTPVPDGKVNPPRKSSDVPAYNEVAKKIMDEEKVTTNDLYSAVLPKLSEHQIPVNVHFKASGSAFLAERVTAAIEAALKE